MKEVVSIGLGRKILLEEIMTVGNVGVPLSFVETSGWRTRLDGEVNVWESQS